MFFFLNIIAFADHNQQETGIACVSPSLLGHKSACKEKPSTPPHPTNGRSSLCCLIYALLLADEAMTIPLTGNSNIKPLNVSQALTTGLLQFLLKLMCTRPMRNASLNPFRYGRTPRVLTHSFKAKRHAKLSDKKLPVTRFIKTYDR